MFSTGKSKQSALKKLGSDMITNEANLKNIQIYLFIRLASFFHISLVSEQDAETEM